MASALYQDWENYNFNNPTALRTPSYWYAVKENLPHALSGIKRMPSNWLGFPADIYSAAGYGADRLSAHPELQQEYMNMMFNDPSLRPYENVRREELVSDKPMFTNKAPLGSEWIAEKMGLPERTEHPTELWSEISSELALPFLGKSALSAGKIVKEKLPEFLGKHVPEPFITPITGLNIKPKDSALSPNLTPAKEVDEFGFYSKALDKANNLKQEKGTGEQMKAMLSKAGVKQDEMKWTGLDEILKKPKVSKTEIINHLKENRLRFTEHTLRHKGDFTDWSGEKVFKAKGLENIRYWKDKNTGMVIVEQLGKGKRGETPYKANQYVIYNDMYEAKRQTLNPRLDHEVHRELDLNEAKVQARLHSNRTPTKDESYYDDIVEGYVETDLNDGIDFLKEKNYQEIQFSLGDQKKTQFGDEGVLYKSPHWRNPESDNMIFSARTTDRTTPDGKKSLHIEELQSDWAQRGRKQVDADDKIKTLGFKLKGKERTTVENRINEINDQLFIKPKFHSMMNEDALIKELDTLKAKLASDIPKAPIIEATPQWTELAIKRLITKAQKEGYDQISFSSGAVQHSRWPREGLKKYYDEIIPKAAKEVTKKMDDVSIGKIDSSELNDLDDTVGDYGIRFIIKLSPKKKANLEGFPYMGVAPFALAPTLYENNNSR